MEYLGPERINEDVQPGMILVSHQFRYANRAKRSAPWSLEVARDREKVNAYSERRERQLFLVESVSYVDIEGRPIARWKRFGDKAIAIGRLIRKDTQKPSKVTMRIPLAIYNSSAVSDALLVGKLEQGEIKLWSKRYFLTEKQWQRTRRPGLKRRASRARA